MNPQLLGLRGLGVRAACAQQKDRRSEGIGANQPSASACWAKSRQKMAAAGGEREIGWRSRYQCGSGRYRDHRRLAPAMITLVRLRCFDFDRTDLLVRRRRLELRTR